MRRLTTISLLVAVELALSAAESMLPPLIQLPGIKLGLANIITLTGFAILPKRQVLLVVVMRLTLAGLLFGSLLTPVFWISCGGGILSFCVMAMLHGRGHFSVVGISLAGAAAHNLGQIGIVYVLLGNAGIFYYLPWLLLWSVPMGLFTGFSARAAISALRKTGINGRMEEADAARNKKDNRLRRIFWNWQGKQRQMRGSIQMVCDRTDGGSGRRQKQKRQVRGGGCDGDRRK